jgi:hypothetical protein
MEKNSRKRGYWRLVRKTAWELSRQHFEWTFPLATGVAVIVFDVLIRGWDKAMDNLSSTLIAAVAAVAVAVLIYAVNLGRAASGMHAEQLRSIERLEKERNEAWQRRDEALKDAETRRRTEQERDELKAELDVALAALAARPRLLAEFDQSTIEQQPDGVLRARIRVMSHGAATVTGVSVICESIELCDAPSEERLRFADFVKSHQFSNLPMRVHGDTDQPLKPLKHAIDVHDGDRVLFEVVSLDGDGVVFEHARQWESFTPTLGRTFHGARQRLASGVYRLRLKVQGQNVPTVPLTLLVSHTANERSVRRED